MLWFKSRTVHVPSGESVRKSRVMHNPPLPAGLINNDLDRAEHIQQGSICPEEI